MNMHTAQQVLPSEITLRSDEVMDDLLTNDALRFLYKLHKKFEDRRRALLKARIQRKRDLDSGEMPSFPSDTEYIHSSRWRVSPVKRDIEQRLLEFAGPADNSLNYLNGIQADAFIADLEDATAPRWKNIIRTQRNLKDGIRGRNNLSAFPILGLKPRALNRTDANIMINNEPISASLLDFGLFFFHNAPGLLDKGASPYLLLPKVESNCEARWWNQVFMFSQYHLGIPQGTVKGVIVIDNLPAAFQINAMLYELRDHTAGITFEPLNYLQSIIRTMPSTITPGSISSISMRDTGLNAVRRLIIDTCYRRKSSAIGMSMVPASTDAMLDDIMAGYDGMRLTNPEQADQILECLRERDEEIIRMEEYKVSEKDLLSFPIKRISPEDYQANIRKSLIYLAGVFAGSGCTQYEGTYLDRSYAGLMIGQLWHWLHNTEKLENGKAVTRELYQDMITREIEEARSFLGAAKDEYLTLAVQHLDKLIVEKQFRDIFPDSLT